MVVYKASDINYSWETNDVDENHPKVCGYIKEGSGNRSALANVLTTNDSMPSFDAELESDDSDAEPNISNASDEIVYKNSSISSIKRYKRQADQYEYTPTKTRCPLLLVADYRFFQEMGGGNTKTTINYLVCETKWFDLIQSTN